MLGTELALPVISVITAIIVISILLYQFNNRIGRSRTVRIIDKGKVCDPSLGELPIIPAKNCQKSDGSSVECYQPDPNLDLIFEIGTTPVYFQSICSRLCEQISVNGGCANESTSFSTCISLLEPPKGCISSANPLGRLEGSNDVYYANDIVI